MTEQDKKSMREMVLEKSVKLHKNRQHEWIDWAYGLAAQIGCTDLPKMQRQTTALIGDDADVLSIRATLSSTIKNIYLDLCDLKEAYERLVRAESYESESASMWRTWARECFMEAGWDIDDTEMTDRELRTELSKMLKKPRKSRQR